MNQHHWIAAALLIGYVVFVTLRGEIPAYVAVFTGQSPPVDKLQQSLNQMESIP